MRALQTSSIQSPHLNHCWIDARWRSFSELLICVVAHVLQMLCFRSQRKIWIQIKSRQQRCLPGCQNSALNEIKLNYRMHRESRLKINQAILRGGDRYMSHGRTASSKHEREFQIKVHKCCSFQQQQMKHVPLNYVVQMSCIRKPSSQGKFSFPFIAEIMQWISALHCRKNNCALLCRYVIHACIQSTDSI